MFNALIAMNQLIKRGPGDEAIDWVHVRGLVQSPCGKINVIMTLGGRGSWSMTFYNCIVSRF